jgi:formylglycine-generating enzyme required for sulfatase activity
MRRLFVLAALFAALPAEAVLIDALVVANPGNTPDAPGNCWAGGCGSVAERYVIGTYEVTNAQYAEFLNAVAGADPNGLYNPSMGTSARGGITRSGGSGSYAYAVKGGYANEPVVFVSFYDALRFANWLDNGEPVGAQGAGTTEDGAYTITPGGVAANSITRNPGALAFLPTENEWYKAAYYDPGAGLYWVYPMQIDTLPSSDPPPGVSSSGNFWSSTYAVTGSGSYDDAFDYLTDVGAYASAPSAYGTFDQGGNVWEWNETVGAAPLERGVRGGGWNDQDSYLSASVYTDYDPATELDELGFRIAPEPGEALLAAAAALTLAFERARRR